MAGARALEQTVVPLGVKQPLFCKARLLEAVVHVGGQDKIVLILYQLVQPVVDRAGRVHVAVDPDVPAPVGPVFFQGVVGVKAPGIHIRKVVSGGKIAEVTPEPFPFVFEPGGGRQPRSRPDQDGVRLFQLPAQQGRLTREGAGRFPGPYP